MFTKHNGNYVTEASSLSWPPGEYMSKVEVDGETFLFGWAEGWPHVNRWVYTNEHTGGDTLVIVFND